MLFNIHVNIGELNCELHLSRSHITTYLSMFFNIHIKLLRPLGRDHTFSLSVPKANEKEIRWHIDKLR